MAAAVFELGIENLALRHLSNLDMQRQLEVLHLLRRLGVEGGRTALVALHDLNLAARFADSIVVLSDGVIRAVGPPRAVLTAELLRSVYGIVADVNAGADGVPHVVPVASARTLARQQLWEEKDVVRQ